MKDLLNKALKDDVVGFTKELKVELDNQLNTRKEEMRKGIFSEDKEED